MNNCYFFNKLHFNSGKFDKSIDATYIIHLKGNGRIENIYNQLDHFQPTNTVYILFNNGFKKCTKELPEQTTTHDLVDAFITIFKHADLNSYDNILILEDDFIFDDEIKNVLVQKDINAFLNYNKETSFIYYLGCLPFLRVGSLTNHNRILLSSEAQSCVYSKSMRSYTYTIDRNSIFDWDVYLNMYPFGFTRYGYYKQLCSQLHLHTENSDNWWNPFGMADIFKKLKNSIALHKHIEPGHSYFYFLSFFIFWFSIIVILMIIIYLFSRNFRKFYRRCGALYQPYLYPNLSR